MTEEFVVRRAGYAVVLERVIVEMVPGDKPIMGRTDAEIVGMIHELTVKREAYAGGKM